MKFNFNRKTIINFDSIKGSQTPGITPKKNTFSSDLGSNFMSTFLLKSKPFNWSFTKFLSCFLLLFMFVNVSNAQTILTWNTFGNAGTETTEPSSSNNANISSASLNYTGSTVTPAGNANRFGGSGWGTTTSVSTDKFIQFTVSPNVGFSFTPTSFEFIWHRSGSGPQNVTLRSSVDNYTSDIGTLTGLAESSNTFRIITISGLTNITTATNFRLYGYNASASGGTGGFDCTSSQNNVVLNGTVTATATPSIGISNGSIAPGNINNGQTNVVLQRYDLVVTTANATLNGLTVTTAGSYTASDLTNLKVRYSTDATLDGSDATLSTKTTGLGSGSQVFPSFTSQVINSGSTGYIFVTADIAPGAANGNTIFVDETAFSNISFTSGTKTGTDPVAVGGTQTIVVAVPDIALSSPASSTADFTVGTNNNELYRFDLAVTTANTTLTGVTINTAGTYVASDLTNLKCWYSADATFNAGSDLLLSTKTTGLGTGSQVFPTFSSQAINSGTTGYIFITTDIPLTATPNNTISVDAITTGDLTFASGNKTGMANASGTKTIIDCTPTDVTGAAASSANLSSVLTWTNPLCFDEILIVAAAAANTGTPTGDGTSYTANLSYSSGTALGNGYVVYKGSTSNQTVTDLVNGTTYFFKFFTRRGTTWSAGTEVSATPNIAGYYWNGGSISANPANGGTGTWGTANAWRQPSASGAQATWVNNNNAIFAGTAGTVTLDDNRTATAYYFNTSGYTLSTTSTTTRALNGPIVLGDNVSLTFSPNVNLGTPSNGTFNVDNITGTGTAGISISSAQGTGTTIAQRINLASVNAFISVPITITSAGGSGIGTVAGIVGTATGTTLTSEATITNNTNIKTMIGATSGNDITVNSVISGSADLQFSGGASGGAGTITLNAANDYTGATIFNSANSGVIRLGITNALPSGTNVTMANSTSNGGILDLNGFNQTIASLANGIGGGSIRNNGASNAVLTIDGSTSTSFGLPITNGTGGLSLVKSGSSTLTLSSTGNTYEGATTVTSGVLRLGAAGVIANASNIVLNGGTFSTGENTGFSETVGTLNLSANSTIALGMGNHSLTFAASNGVTWTGTTLTVTGWTGTAGASGTGGKIFVGNNTSGLTSGQLAKISFDGYSGTATILNTGEVVPEGAGPTASVLSNGTGNSTICAGGIANIKVTITGGASPYMVVYSDGTNNFTVNNYVSGADITVSPLTTKTYSLVSVTDNNSLPGANNSGSAMVVVSNPTVTNTVGTYMTTFNHVDGATHNYTDGTNCVSLGIITDAAGGNVLGSTTMSMELLNSLPQNTNNNRYFLPRYYTITPTSNGVSTVQLYITQEDLNFYNSNNGNQADLPSSGNNSDPAKVHMRVMQVTGNGDLTTGTLVPDYAEMNWDGTNNYWVVDVPTTITNSNNFQTSGKYYFFTNESCSGVTVTNVVAGSVTQNTAVITWDAVSTLQGWYAIRHREVGSQNWIYGTSPTNSKLLVGLVSGKQYEVNVNRKCSIVDSSAWNTTLQFSTIGCTNGTPVINTPTATATTVTISWNAVLVGGGWHDIQYRQIGSPTWINSSSGPGNSATLGGLTSGTSYEIRVRASCSLGSPSLWSNAVTFSTIGCTNGTPVINTPTATATTVTISWNAVLVGGGWHDIQYRQIGSPTWINSSSGPGNSATLGGLTSGTNYEIRVRASCSLGSPSLWSNAVTFSTTGCVNGTLVLNAGITTATTVSLSWNAVLVGGGWHDIRYRQVGSPSWQNSSSGSGNSTVLAGLITGITYEAEVRASCVLGSGAWSNTIQFTPSIPSCVNGNITVNTPTVTTTTVSLSWNAVLVGGGWHDIQYRLVGSPTWINSSSGSTNTATLAGLIPNSNYELQLRASCSNGASGAWSNLVTFTTASSFTSDPTTFSGRSSGIGEILSVKIYPNPTAEVLYVSFEAPQAIGTKIRVTDVTGRVVREMYYTSTEGYNQTEINLGDLVQGVYMLQVSSGDGWLYTGRVVKTQ